MLFFFFFYQEYDRVMGKRNVQNGTSETWCVHDKCGVTMRVNDLIERIRDASWDRTKHWILHLFIFPYGVSAGERGETAGEENGSEKKWHDHRTQRRGREMRVLLFLSCELLGAPIWYLFSSLFTLGGRRILYCSMLYLPAQSSEHVTIDVDRLNQKVALILSLPS